VDNRGAAHLRAKMRLWMNAAMDVREAGRPEALATNEEQKTTNIFRELAARHNATPRGQRLVGYIGGFCSIICFIGIFVAYQEGVGFIVLLVLTFFLFLFGDHYKYAFMENLSQRKVRRMDYWYLSAGAIGLFLAAFGYSTEREATIAKFSKKVYEAGESSVVVSVNEEIGSLSKFLCVDLKNAKEACAGLKKVASQIRPGHSPAEIASISEEFEKKVTIPYARIFPADELSKNPNLLLPVVSVQIKFDDWKQYAEHAPKVDEVRSKTDDKTKIMLEVGRWVIWPFFLAFALALRITKVTIDVFDWAKV